MLKKLFLLLVKFMPAIHMVGMIVNNTLAYFDCNIRINIALDFILGNSIYTSIILYVISYTFKFCNWYRIIITANLINLIIAMMDSIYTIPISNLKLFMIYYIINSVSIVIITLNNIKHDTKKDKNDKRTISREYKQHRCW